MSIRSLLAVVLICVSMSAAADFVVVSKAYEVRLSELRLPGTANGTATFRECETCDWHTVRVNSATRYELNSQPLSLQDLRKELENVRDASDVPVTVLHHLESDTIKSIRVWF